MMSSFTPGFIADVTAGHSFLDFFFGHYFTENVFLYLW